MKLFKTSTLVLAAATAAAAHAAPPDPIRASGKTLASSQLATDVLNKIADYNHKSRGCADLASVQMEVLPRTYVPTQPAVPATDRGGHFERWSVDACGSTQQFQVGLWPSPQGGSDFAVTPLARVQRTAAASAADPTPVSGLPAWHGRYVWEESLGRIGGSLPSEGAAAFVTHTLTLRAANGTTRCVLEAQGFQTNTRIQCTATPQGVSVIIKFYKFGPDNVGGRYTLGERLFTLTRDGGGGLTTQLEGLTPSSDATVRKGRFFKKVN